MSIYLASSDEKTQISSNTQPLAAKPEQPSQNDQALKIETITVTYDESGFTPKEVTVAKGSTVNFLNKSQIPLWVASDPHPAHTDYPEFDTVYGRSDYPAMGENYSFKFDKVGTWKYHSHTASGDATDTAVHPGVVIVQ